MSGSSRKGLSGVRGPPPAKQAKGAVCNQVLCGRDWPQGSPCGGCSEVLRMDQVKGRDRYFEVLYFLHGFCFLFFLLSLPCVFTFFITVFGSLSVTNFSSQQGLADCIWGIYIALLPT